jgi:hypothetical protein
MMEEVLGKDLPTNVYLDDVGTKGDEIPKLIDDTAEVIIRLAVAGLMVNLAKSIIAATEQKLMGHLWRSGGYYSATGKKISELTRLTHEELRRISPQSLYGTLNYYREYLANFSERIMPI